MPHTRLVHLRIHAAFQRDLVVAPYMLPMIRFCWPNIQIDVSELVDEKDAPDAASAWADLERDYGEERTKRVYGALANLSMMIEQNIADHAAWKRQLETEHVRLQEEARERQRVGNEQWEKDELERKKSRIRMEAKVKIEGEQQEKELRAEAENDERAERGLPDDSANTAAGDAPPVIDRRKGPRAAKGARKAKV